MIMIIISATVGSAIGATLLWGIIYGVYFIKSFFEKDNIAGGEEDWG